MFDYNRLEMKVKLNQHGLAHIGLVILIVVVIAVVGAVGFRVFQQKANEGTSNKTSQSEQAGQDESAIELQNFGLVSMDSVLVTTDALSEYDSMGLKGFYPFGDKLGGKDDTRLNPNFEFSSLKQGTKVVSAIDGIVAFIKEQPDTGDYEVFIQPSEGSVWTVGYDHISKVVVKKGDSIKAGAVIGDPTPQGNGALRFEIQVNKDQSGTTTHVCPSTLLASDVKDSALQELTAMQQAWNTVTGRALYDVTAQNPVGCLKTTMSVSEAEGR
jgi:hypothetical protein